MGTGCLRGLNNPFSAPGADNVHRRFGLEPPSLLFREEALCKKAAMPLEQPILRCITKLRMRENQGKLVFTSAQIEGKVTYFFVTFLLAPVT